MPKLVLAYADDMLMILSTDESVKIKILWILKHMFKAAGSKISLRPAICLIGLTNMNRWSPWKRWLFKNEPTESLEGFLQSQNNEKITRKINVADKLLSLADLEVILLYWMCH